MRTSICRLHLVIVFLVIVFLVIVFLVLVFLVITFLVIAISCLRTPSVLARRGGAAGNWRWLNKCTCCTRIRVLIGVVGSFVVVAGLVRPCMEVVAVVI